MPTQRTIGGGDKALESAALQKYTGYKSAFLQVREGMQVKLEALSPAQVTGAVNTLTNWTPGSAVTIAKVDSLYAGLALLYCVVFYLALKNRV